MEVREGTSEQEQLNSLLGKTVQAQGKVGAKTLGDITVRGEEQGGRSCFPEGVSEEGSNRR